MEIAQKKNKNMKEQQPRTEFWQISFNDISLAFKNNHLAVA